LHIGCLREVSKFNYTIFEDNVNKEGFEYFFQLLDEFWRRNEGLQVDEVEVEGGMAIANKGDRSLAF
jgi:hypothetical protein